MTTGLITFRWFRTGTSLMITSIIKDVWTQGDDIDRSVSQKQDIFKTTSQILDPEEGEYQITKKIEKNTLFSVVSRTKNQATSSVIKQVLKNRKLSSIFIVISVADPRNHSIDYQRNENLEYIDKIQVELPNLNENFSYNLKNSTSLKNIKEGNSRDTLSVWSSLTELEGTPRKSNSKQLLGLVSIYPNSRSISKSNSHRGTGNPPSPSKSSKILKTSKISKFSKILNKEKTPKISKIKESQTVDNRSAKTKKFYVEGTNKIQKFGPDCFINLDQPLIKSSPTLD